MKVYPFAVTRSLVAAAALRPFEEMFHTAEAVWDHVLAPRAQQEHVCVGERGAAEGAALQRRVLHRRARFPPGAADRPRHDVLEPAEDRAAAARGLVGAIAVAVLDGRSAPGALVAHGSTNLRSPAARTSGSPSRAAIVIGTRGSRVGKSAVATLRPPNAAARPRSA